MTIQVNKYELKNDSSCLMWPFKANLELRWIDSLSKRLIGEANRLLIALFSAFDVHILSLNFIAWVIEFSKSISSSSKYFRRAFSFFFFCADNGICHVFKFRRKLYQCSVLSKTPNSRRYQIIYEFYCIINKMSRLKLLKFSNFCSQINRIWESL